MIAAPQPPPIDGGPARRNGPSNAAVAVPFPRTSAHRSSHLLRVDGGMANSATTSVSPKILSVSQVGLFALAVLYTIHIAKPVLLPIVLAVLLSFLLAPLVSSLREYGLPRGVASVVVLAGATLVVGYALTKLFGPAAEWIGEAPARIEQVEDRIRVILEPVEQVSKAADEVEEALGGQESGPTVSVETETLFNFLLNRARALVGGIVVTWALIMFFLTSGDLFLRKLVRVLTTMTSRKRAVRVSRRIRENLSHHLLTVTVINAVLGIAVGTTLALLGMPNPVLWGAMAALLNYIPYLGALVGVGIVGLVSITTFDTLTMGLAAPLIYLTLTVLEGTFLTPAVLGRRMRLNPVAVFLGILVLGWMWGAPGALLAVPILSAVKVLADAYPGLLVVSEFLGR